jgi:hypothetical protein
MQGPFSSDDLEQNCVAGKYDLKINMKHVVEYHVLNNFKLWSQYPELYKITTEAENRLLPYRFILRNHPIFDGLFGRLMAKYSMNCVEANGYLGGLKMDRSTRPKINVTKSMPDVTEELGLTSSQRVALEKNNYIVVHNGFDVDHYLVGASKAPTKIWPVQHWECLIKSIKEEFPDLTIVQVGHAASSPELRGVDINLVGKTSLEDVVTILKNATLHITPEGGLLRVAWALGTQTISLQGPSGSDFFQFGQTHSIISSTCNGCWYVLDEWMARCYRGYQNARCMSGIRPENVAKEVVKILNSKRIKN